MTVMKVGKESLFKFILNSLLLVFFIFGVNYTLHTFKNILGVQNSAYLSILFLNLLICLTFIIFTLIKPISWLYSIAVSYPLIWMYLSTKDNIHMSLEKTNSYILPFILIFLIPIISVIFSTLGIWIGRKLSKIVHFDVTPLVEEVNMDDHDKPNVMKFKHPFHRFLYISFMGPFLVKALTQTVFIPCLFLECQISLSNSILLAWVLIIAVMVFIGYRVTEYFWYYPITIGFLTTILNFLFGWEKVIHLLNTNKSQPLDLYIDASVTTFLYIVPGFLGILIGRLILKRNELHKMISFSR